MTNNTKSLRKKLYETVASATYTVLKDPKITFDRAEKLHDETVDSILQLIEESLPKEVNYNQNNVPEYLKPTESGSWHEAIRHEQGYNQALKDFRDILRGEKTHAK